MLFLSSCMYYGDSRQEIIDAQRAEQSHDADAYSDGYDDGYNDGLDNGYSAGYADGYRDGLAASSVPSRSSVAAAILPASADYVLNTNSKKFHYPDCSSVDQMSDQNKKYFSGTREEVIAMGYQPCGRCNP